MKEEKFGPASSFLLFILLVHKNFSFFILFLFAGMSFLSMSWIEPKSEAFRAPASGWSLWLLYPAERKEIRHNRHFFLSSFIGGPSSFSLILNWGLLNERNERKNSMVMPDLHYIFFILIIILLGTLCSFLFYYCAQHLDY